MSEWKEVRLGEWMQFNPSRTIKKGHMARKIPMDSLVPYSKTIDKYYYEPYKGGAKFQNGDTIMARITPCLENGKHAFISLLDQNETAFGSTEYIVMCGIEGISDNDFVYYLTHTPFFKNHAIKSMVGSSGRQRAQVDVLQNLIMLVPTSLIEQRRIAAFLSSLDSKIENNRKICANLEAQAQALFKHWFIDFAPFKDGKFVESELGMIPEGWRVGTLTDILENIKYTIKQGDFPELPYLPIDSIPMYSFLVNDIKDNSEAQSSLILFKKYDILVGAMRVYFHRVIPAPFDGITRSTCFVLRPKVWNFYSFALCSVNSNQAILHAQKTSKGSTMPYAVWEGGLGAFSIVIPPESVAREFNYLIKKYIDIIQYTYFENQKLTTLRDTLLPKLMSGEIKV